MEHPTPGRRRPVLRAAALAFPLLVLSPGGLAQDSATPSAASTGSDARVQPGDNHRLWFQHPATDWRTQALHLGNGYLGGSFYGGVKEERFDITEKSMWRGGPGENPDYRYGIVPGGSDHLSEIRAAVVAGDVARADRLVHDHFRGDYSNFGAFSTIGSLYFAFDEHDGTPSDYRRELDLSRSVARVSYRIDSRSYERQYFCSYPDRIMVMRFRSQSPGGLGFTVRHELLNTASSISIAGPRLTVTGKIDGNDREYRVRVVVLHQGGTLVADGDRLKLTGADSAVVLYAAATEYLPVPPDYKGADPDALTAAQVEAAAQKTYEQLLDRHVCDYRRLYDRVELHLSGDPAAEELPTDQRWLEFKKSVGDHGGSSDTGLKVLLFNLGRYLLISASRPGTLPSTLQGVWNTFPEAPWRGNYQSNINLQEMYWPCGPLNLLECQRAYVDWIRALVIPGREVAEAYYGTPGWVSHTTGNIWGFASPGTALIWGIYPVGAAWHCQHLWEHYAFSMDEEYLAREAYPVMKEAARFWLENLVPFEGYLISAPTVSAEHGVQQKDGAFIDPTVKAESRPEDGSVHRYNIPGAYQDIEMVHDLFSNVIEAADLLGIDREFRASLESARSKLLPLKIGRHGQLQEWFWDIDSPEDHHRHISHLWALHPGRTIHPLLDRELAAAARKSLDMRGDGHSGPMWVYSGGNWARTWRIWCWARLLDGDRADRIFTGMIAEQGFQNLMTHQSTRMQVDASMSTPGFMAEMLLQSHLGEIHLLPALPRAWPDGGVAGLVARGAHVVDIDWRDGHLIHARVRVSGPGVPRIRVEGELIDPAADPRVELHGTPRRPGPAASMQDYQDVRGKDLSDLDLSGRSELPATLIFNQATVWPGDLRMPAGIQPRQILIDGMEPGLGVRALHRQGIDGRGVRVAIIDQPLFVHHPEFDGKIAAYHDVGCGSDTSMHGPAVASLLVGSRCGTAPGARLHYVAAPSWTRDAACQAEALDWLVEQNEKLPASEKIRVVSVSAAPSGPGSPFDENNEAWDRACARAEAVGIMVLDCTGHRGFIGPCYPGDGDRESATTYEPGFPGRERSLFPGRLLVPSSRRTTAEERTRGDHAYIYWGRGGLSWSIPYCAGVLALGWQLRPELTPSRMRELLFESAHLTAEGVKILDPQQFVRLVKEQ